MHFDGSNGRPVILCGPFGISRTVNLNCATNSPIKIEEYKVNDIEAIVNYYYVKPKIIKLIKEYLLSFSCKT